MNEQTYELLITVLGGGLIPGLLGIINTIITLRAKRGQRGVIQHINQAKSEQTEPISRKGRPRMLLFVVLIAVGAAIGFYIGNVTKKSLHVVRHYSPDERRSVSRERITDIERQIHEIERERERILEQPRLPEPEKKAKVQSYNKRIDQLTMEKREFEKIERQVEHYSQDKQRSVSREKIADIERQIHEIERERERILEQPRLPEPEKKAKVQSYNKRIDQLTMEKREFEKIERQVEIP